MSLLNKDYVFDVIRGWPGTGALETTFPNKIVDGEQVQIDEGTPCTFEASHNIHTVADETAMLALSAEVGDVAVRDDVADSIYVLTALPATDLDNWDARQNLNAIKNTTFTRPAAAGDENKPLLVAVNSTEDYDGEFVKKTTLLFSGYIFRTDRIAGTTTDGSLSSNSEVVFDGTTLRQRDSETTRTQGFVEDPSDGEAVTVIIP